MYTNSIVTKLSETNVIDSKGFKRPTFEDIFGFDADSQPYTTALAQKEYGLTEVGVEYRCYVEDTSKQIGTGDHFSVDLSPDAIYICVYAHKWENHIEFILKKVRYHG